MKTTPEVKGFIYEATVKVRYFVPLTDEIQKYIHDYDWEHRHYEEGETEDQFTQFTKDHIGSRLENALECQRLFTDENPDILDHVDKVKQFVCNVEPEEWSEASVIYMGEDPLTKPCEFLA
jgi:hypothetical protein